VLVYLVLRYTTGMTLLKTKILYFVLKVFTLTIKNIMYL